MEEEIDLDQVMGMDDSFCVVNDEDVLRILQTWRLNGLEGAHYNGEGSQVKLIDSRTFTRPKKRISEFGMPSTSTEVSSGPQRVLINPQIGGLLSSPFNLQRSLINDVSPPSSLASSSISYNDCGNSLINSGDFANISNLLDEGLGASFMRMNSLRASRFSKRLADFDETITKDNSIAKTDMHGIESSSGNSTLQNSVEFDDDKNNDTFVQPSLPPPPTTTTACDATFDKDNNTVVVGGGGTVPNDKTFNGIDTQNVTFLKINQTFDAVQQEVEALNATFTPPSTSPTDDFESPLNGPALLPQSTPTVSTHRHVTNIQVEDLSPIATNPPILLRKSRPSALEDDDKRMSLQNFEDVEKSISLLENNNEAAFDVILEDMAEFKKSLENEKLRQNLQNIKNRHSTHIERQEEMKKSKNDLMNGTITLDNKLIDSMNRSAGGNERLLNRRSRLDDEYQQQMQQQQQLQTTPPQETQGSGGGGTSVTPRSASERKSNRDRFKTMRICKKHIEGMVVIDPDEDDDGMEAFEAEERQAEMYETMIIEQAPPPPVVTVSSRPPAPEKDFKKPELPPQPQSKLKPRSLSKPRYYSGLYKKDGLSLPLAGKASSIDHLDSNRLNSQDNLDATIVVSSQPKYPTKSTIKSPMGIKSKSYHNLTFNTNNNQNGAAQLKPASSTGTGLRFGGRPSTAHNELPQQRMQPRQSTIGLRNSRPNVRPTMPARASLAPNAKPIASSNNYASRGTAANAATQLKATASSGMPRPALVRPSSGYYNYGNNRMTVKPDSDTESGRTSPNSLSSSSASSRGSLYPPEPTIQAKLMQNSVEDVSSGASDCPKIVQPVSRIARPSGLKPPTVRSGLPRPTGFVKR